MSKPFFQNNTSPSVSHGRIVNTKQTTPAKHSLHRLMSAPLWLWMSVWIAGLVVSVIIHEWSMLDFWIQDFFYNTQTSNWLVAARDPLPRFMFYLLPKWGMISTTVALGFWLGSDLLGKRYRSRECRARLVLFLTLICTPLVVGLIKRYSGVWCPAELTRYGGEHVYRMLFQSRSLDEKVGHCFPGGHASAGFAFMAMFYLSESKKMGLFLGLFGCAVGWVMGLYQMFKGAHFMSHTTTTMCIAGVIAMLAAHFILNHESDGHISG